MKEVSSVISVERDQGEIVILELNSWSDGSITLDVEWERDKDGASVYTFDFTELELKKINDAYELIKRKKGNVVLCDSETLKPLSPQAVGALEKGTASNGQIICSDCKEERK